MAKFAKKALDNRELLNHIATMHVKALDVYRDFRRDCVKWFNYVEGNSWDKAVAERLRTLGLPILYINIILPRVLNIIGNYGDNKGRLMAVPFREDAVTDADVATRLLDWENDEGWRDKQIKRALFDSVICGVGWIKDVWDTDEDPLGKTRPERVHPLFVMRDPAFAPYDITKWRWCEESYFMSLENVKALYPEKSREIDTATADVGHHRYSWQESLSDWWMGLKGTGEELRNEFVNRKEDTYRVIEFHERRKMKTAFVMNMISGAVSEPMSEGEAKSVVGGFSDLEIHIDERDEIWTHIALADYVLLSSFKRKVQNGMFPLIPIFCYDFTEKPFGVVSQLDGPQTQYQQAKSSQLAVLHTMANSGWQYEEGALDPEMEERLEKEGGGIGLVLKHKTGHPEPHKIAPNPVPSGLVNYAQDALQDADNITTVGASQLGQPEKGSESGVLHRQRVVQSLKSLRWIFDNADYSEMLVGKYSLDLMQVHLSPGRAIGITGDDDTAQLVVPEGLNLNSFKTKIVQGNFTETQRFFRRSEMMEFLQVVQASGRGDVLAGMLPMLARLFLDTPDVKEVLDIIENNRQIPPQMRAEIAQLISDIEMGRETEELPEQELIGSTTQR